MDKFILHSNYKPTGDQPEAIKALTDGVNKGLKEQTLLGDGADDDLLRCQRKRRGTLVFLLCGKGLED